MAFLDYNENSFDDCDLYSQIMSITEDQPVIKKQHSVAQRGAEELLLAPLDDSILSNSPQKSDTELS